MGVPSEVGGRRRDVTALDRDRTGAQGVGGGPYFSFIIVGVQSGRAVDLQSWLLSADGTQFEPEPII